MSLTSMRSPEEPVADKPATLDPTTKIGLVGETPLRSPRWFSPLHTPGVP